MFSKINDTPLKGFYLPISGAGGHLLWLGEVRRSPPSLLTLACAWVGRPCFSSSDVFLFCWAAFLSISLLASVFPVSLPLFFLFFRPCLIHARLPEGGRAFVHGHTFLHSWSGPMTVVIGLLHGATFLSNLPLVLFVSFIGPWQLEKTPIKPHLQLLAHFVATPYFSLTEFTCSQ